MTLLRTQECFDFPMFQVSYALVATIGKRTADCSRGEQRSLQTIDAEGVKAVDEDYSQSGRYRITTKLTQACFCIAN